jgi:hypothetical protein
MYPWLSLRNHCQVFCTLSSIVISSRHGSREGACGRALWPAAGVVGPEMWADDDLVGPFPISFRCDGRKRNSSLMVIEIYDRR